MSGTHETMNYDAQEEVFFNPVNPLPSLSSNDLQKIKYKIDLGKDDARVPSTGRSASCRQTSGRETETSGFRMGEEDRTGQTLCE